ncbi:hypothetical protein ZWY2020_052788 [Hordeum vulgare]|nr:hypothetical protein ZWY2020_052788 [Hordeum vulgare]
MPPQDGRKHGSRYRLRLHPRRHPGGENLPSCPVARGLLWPSATAGQSTSGKKLVFFGSAAAVQPFDLEDLLRAAEVLGKGAIGTTYKVVLESSATMAVKGLKVSP